LAKQPIQRIRIEHGHGQPFRVRPCTAQFLEIRHEFTVLVDAAAISCCIFSPARCSASRSATLGLGLSGYKCQLLTRVA
jgi:hypothetical protein